MDLTDLGKLNPNFIVQKSRGESVHSSKPALLHIHTDPTYCRFQEGLRVQEQVDWQQEEWLKIYIKIGTRVPSLIMHTWAPKCPISAKGWGLIVRKAGRRGTMVLGNATCTWVSRGRIKSWGCIHSQKKILESQLISLTKREFPPGKTKKSKKTEFF